MRRYLVPRVSQYRPNSTSGKPDWPYKEAPEGSQDTSRESLAPQQRQDKYYTKKISEK